MITKERALLEKLEDLLEEIRYSRVGLYSQLDACLKIIEELKAND